MQGTGATLAAPVEERRAHEELVSAAHGRCGKVPAEWLARHVRSLYGAADWPVQREALAAVLRRFAFARRDGLAVVSRPERGPFGAWRTGRGGRGSARRGAKRARRPYDTRLEELDPLRATCDCPDFPRNSLGLCKHVLMVLDDLARRSRDWERALAGPTAKQAASRKTRLAWDPVRPLRGAGDWMERLRLIPGAERRESESLVRVRRRFTAGVGEGLVLKDAFRDRPARRLALVEELQGFARARSRSGQGVDSALLARLADERAALERAVELGRAKKRVLGSLSSLGRRLYPFQVEGVEGFLRTGRLLLADDMGLGKTAQAIAIGHGLLRGRLVERGLLIVPASLKPQWKREWEAFSDAPLALVDGSPAERAATYRRTRSGFLVANYEQVLRDLELMLAWDPDLVVLDEAQRIKNWAAKTSHAVKGLRPAYRVVLTGTPMENRLEELASIMDWVDDHALEPKWRLAPWHVQAADGDPAVRGARNLDTLRERIAPVTVRRLRRDVLGQLPPRTDTVVPVELTDQQREAHDELLQPILTLSSQARRRPLTQAEFLRLMSLLTTQRIVANGLAQLEFREVWPGLERRRPRPSVLRGLCAPKLGELRELLPSLVVEQGRKVVVFSQWRRMLQLASWAVSDLLEEHGLRGVFFSGREGRARRTQNLVDFHDDPATRVLFATDAGGVGLNLQRAATACVNLELPWNPAVLEQRIARIHRLGQTEPVDVYNLVSQESIEERIAGLVADKQMLFRGLFDGDTDEVRFERSGSFMDGVQRLVEDVEAAGAAEDRVESPDLEEDLDEVFEEDGARARGLDELVDAGDESADAPAAQAPASAALPDTAAEVRGLFAQLAITPTAEGGVRIEAPPEAAASLAALFEGMAGLLRGVAR